VSIAFRNGVSSWVDGVCRHAWFVLVASLVLTGLSGWYTATHLAIDTDTDGMLSSELDFRQNSIRLKQAFPQLSNNIAIVIDGDTADQADDAALALARALRGQPGLFRNVFDPRGEPFLRRNGLLFLDEDKLGQLVDRLAAAQVFLAKLSRDPSLRGLFGVLRLALDNSDAAASPAELKRVLNAVADAADAEIAGRRDVVSWSGLLDGKRAADDRRRIILVQPRLDFASLAPASDAMATIRRQAVSLGLTRDAGVRIRLTGSAPLEHEELESVAEGMGIAGIVSLTLVLVLLLWGLKSPRLVAALLVTLIMGLIWTAAFATLTVGRLNLISVAFAVLFIGLSVDFGIHFVLRVREEMAKAPSVLAAMRPAADGVSGALWLCAIAAAIAFFSFLPTDYVGLAELGVIAGSGMFIALFANLTVLPACMVIAPPARTAGADAVTVIAAGRRSWRIRHARAIVGVAVVLALAAAALSPLVRFDFDPLNLKDRSTESVQTLFDLMGNEDTAPYTADVLAANEAAAKDLTARLEALPTVKSVLSIERFVPGDQENKLAIIESAALLMLPALEAPRIASPNDARTSVAFKQFRDQLAKMVSSPVSGSASLSPTIRRLWSSLGRLTPTTDTLRSLERRLLSTLPGRLQALRESLEAGPVILADLPPSLWGRFVGQQGQRRLEIFPSENVREQVHLRRFVADVQTVAPHATGSPVIIVAAGEAVVRAFAIAAAISVVTIGILIAVLLRRLRDVLLVFAPLGLAALLTIAASAMLDLPFNFANVIVLPLLFGLGVASAIHLVMRERYAEDLSQVLRSSTPRAVIFSALTTIGSFASIALSSHPGTSSMGVLLTIAIGLTLICTMIVLPALMALFTAKN
jgi:uncharacterized protein